MAKSLEHVIQRVNALRAMNQDLVQQRERTRMIMNGGIDGIHAVMAWDYGKGASMKSRAEVSRAYGVDLPTVNLMASGLERTAQRVGATPTLKPPAAEDYELRARLEKRMRILRGWDQVCELDLDWPQIGRWLPGYGYAMWKIGQKRHDDIPYPYTQLRDSYDVYPGLFGAKQQPQEAAIVRRVPLYELKRAYPDLPWGQYEEKLKANRGYTGRQTPILGAPVSSGQGWEGAKTGIEVVEYMDEYGSCYLIPELEATLAVVDSPLYEPAFVFIKRYAFDKLIGQYNHVVGLMGMQAKLNIMALVASEDSVFRETNIFGDLNQSNYNRGRLAVNLFDRDARVEKPTGDVPQILWQQVDRLERQLRIGSTYDQTQDGISPQAFATGSATRELGNAATTNVAEYHKVIRAGAQRLDHKRLKWADTVWRTSRYRIFDMAGRKENYSPKTDINGGYGTRRVFGAMAGWDDGQKAVVGLQYLSAGVLSIEALQENVDNLEDVTVINEQNRRLQAERTLFARLGQRAAEDPMADAALVEIMENPDKQSEILRKYFTPQEPQLDPLEQAYMDVNGEAPPPVAGPRPPASTILSQVDQSGGVRGGAQTVGRV